MQHSCWHWHAPGPSKHCTGGKVKHCHAIATLLTSCAFLRTWPQPSIIEPVGALLLFIACTPGVNESLHTLLTLLRHMCFVLAEFLQATATLVTSCPFPRMWSQPIPTKLDVPGLA
jgi:hypothetical protein